MVMGGGYNRRIKRFHYYFRRCQTTHNRVLMLWYQCCLRNIKAAYGLEISPDTKIGKGLYLGHPFHITVNQDAILGNNINLHKGATIGQENRGSRKGAPVIGDCVYIGINATIVGKIKIGSDVFIAAGAFVNRDIPDHSIVLGNPCIIRHKSEATKGYIQNAV